MIIQVFSNSIDFPCMELFCNFPCFPELVGTLAIGWPLSGILGVALLLDHICFFSDYLDDKALIYGRRSVALQFNSYRPRQEKKPVFEDCNLTRLNLTCSASETN